MLVILFISFWVSLMIIFSLSVIKACKQGAENLKKLHSIPCYQCDFFTNDFRLKCAVNPTIACSDAALGCIDFEPKTSSKPKNKQKSKRKKYSGNFKGYQFFFSEIQLHNLNSPDNS